MNYPPPVKKVQQIYLPNYINLLIFNPLTPSYLIGILTHTKLSLAEAIKTSSEWNYSELTTWSF